MQIRMFSVALVMAGSLVGCTPSEGPLSDVERAALTDTIVAHMHEYLTVFETLDPQRVAPLYADDPDFRVYSDGQSFTRDGLLAAISDLGGILQSIEATWDTIEVTSLGRDAALAASRFRRTLTDTAGDAVHDWGTVTWVWVRREGEWQIIHGHAVHYLDSTP